MVMRWLVAALIFVLVARWPTIVKRAPVPRLCPFCEGYQTREYPTGDSPGVVRRRVGCSVGKTACGRWKPDRRNRTLVESVRPALGFVLCCGLITSVISPGHWWVGYVWWPVTRLTLEVCVGLGLLLFEVLAKGYALAKTHMWSD